MLGKNISKVEILNVSTLGIWLYLNGTEYFLSYEDFPWFKDKKISEIFNVQLFNKEHLHWPDLDIDISLNTLKNPAEYPLVYK